LARFRIKCSPSVEWRRPRFNNCVLLKFIKQRAARNCCNPWRAARLSLVFPIRMSPVKKRHVFYISGFDPRGVEAYYRLFTEECPKHAALAAGLRTLRQDGIETVWAGVTSIGEVRATTNA